MGYGITLRSNTPVDVKDLTGIKTISAGGNHSIALKEDKTVYTWGNYINGQLGDVGYSESTVARKVNDQSDIKAISAGSVHTVVLKEDGTVYAWGDNQNYQLGDGTNTSHRTSV